eukprot:460698_1
MIYMFGILFFISLLVINTDAFSACDEIDITFVVDTNNVIHNTDAVIEFIVSIINDGSSEQTGFSAVIYGSNIPIHQKIKIISLHDTKSATQRHKAEQKIDNKLKTAFNNIISVATKTNAAYISINDQYDESDDDPKPDKHKPKISGKKNIKYNDDSDPFHPVEKWTKNVAKPESESSAVKQQDTKKSKSKSKDRDNSYENGQKTKNIALLPAFKIATGQSQPKSEGSRMERLGYDPSDKSILGNHDNQQVYIIFDHYNKILKGPSADVDICKLFHHLDTNEIANDDEAAYFMLGTDYSKGEIHSVFCNGAIPKYIKKNTFYRFTNDFAFNSPDMEHIYPLTCPAEIKSPEYNGKINVGNHVQYIDLQTIIGCWLYYIDDDDNPDTPVQLDASKSYIKVKDFINDDNTFKLKDNLVIPPSIIPQMRRINCNAPVMRIVRIVSVDNDVHGTSDSNEANDYKILKLYVQKPGSPMEYIQDAKVHGRVRVHKYKGSGGHVPEHMKKQYNEYDDYVPTDAKQTDNGDNIFYSDKQILKGEMDHILNKNPFASNIAINMLKQRKKRMQNVAKKLYMLRKIRKKFVRKFPNKKRYILSKTFAGHLIESDVLSNPFGISLKDLLSGKIKAEGDLKLVDIDFRKEWIMTKVGEEIEIKDGDTRFMCTILGIPIPNCGMMPKMKMPKMGGGMGNFMKKKRRRRNRRRLFTPPEIEISARGDGDLELKFGYIFRFVVGVKFSFYWQIFTPFIDITFIVYMEWDIGAFFYIASKGEAAFVIDNILHWDKEIKFQIGPIPVTIKPYVDMFGELASVPRPVRTGISCRYNQRLELGFKFCTTPGCKPGPIKKKITKHKGCKKHLGIDHREEQERDYGHNLQCPKPDRAMGFDIKFNVKLGCMLYTIVNIHLRFELVIPFRVVYPAMNSKDCYLPAGLDMCKITKQTQYLKANFHVSMNMNIYLGIFVDFSDIIGTVMQIFGLSEVEGMDQVEEIGGEIAGMIPQIEFEIKIAGPIPIIPKISLGCIDLNEHLLELDTALRHACCSHKTYLPIKPQDEYYDHNYMDNYRHTYSYGDQNPYYDQPHYEDQQFNKKNHFNIHDPYNYNQDNEFSTQYYSPAYHIPVKLKPWMNEWKKHHETRNKMQRKYHVNEIVGKEGKRVKKKYPLPFDVPY